MTNLAPLMSSAKPDWQTPDVVLDLVRQFNGGTIGLDPCTVDDNPTGARHWYTPREDGLSQDWCGYGLVYVNPPYGRTIGHWTAKCISAYLDGAEIVALLPARTDARWWQVEIGAVPAVCFWRGRLRFRGAEASAPFPSAIWYLGPRRFAFRDAFSPRGWVICQ